MEQHMSKAWRMKARYEDDEIKSNARWYKFLKLKLDKEKYDLK